MGSVHQIRDKLNTSLQPNEMYMDLSSEGYQLKQRKLAFWVGLIAVCLPILLLASRLIGVSPRQSLSHYFYVPWLGGIFVISIAFIATFLIAYRGTNPWESKLATIAGWFTFGIALFPTSGLGFLPNNTKVRLYAELAGTDSDTAVTIVHSDLEHAFQLSTWSSTIHFISAFVLFSFLAIYSLFIFTRPVNGVSYREGKITKVKTWRNRIYNSSGVTIVFSILAIGLHNIFGIKNQEWNNIWNTCNLTFWFEVLALASFGIAWMVKGRFWGRVLND